MTVCLVVFVFSDEANFHLSVRGKVNRYNVRIWGTENLHAIVQHERASEMVNIFCAMSQRSVFFFSEKKNSVGHCIPSYDAELSFPSAK